MAAQALGPIAGPLQIFGGMMNAVSILQQREQLEVNAEAAAKNFGVRQRNLLAARTANARREARITSMKLADIESSYSVSGIEMSGDVANYISQVAAVEEQNSQQLTQDAFYASAVMETQKNNLLTQADNQKDAMLFSAVSSIFGGAMAGAETMSEDDFYKSAIKEENDYYWSTFGPVPGSGLGISTGTNILEK